ncbi:MAG: Rrf2 family transcriptional regulator [Fimbriimonadaceae bacterium]|nr:Rrf2 family transcriptional regulator [Fimbriimonadaceae bacterium]
MKFSAQEEYGLRCILSIATSDGGSGITIPELSQMEGMTQPHVAKMLSILRKAGFITSTRGQQGGYSLALEPSKIVVGDLLEALGGRLYEPAFCERHSGSQDECAHQGGCNLRPLWSRIQSAVDAIVYRLTVQDLIDGKLDIGENARFQVAPRREPVAGQ